MKNDGRRQSFYIGLAILILLFFISGLSAALRQDKQKDIVVHSKEEIKQEKKFPEAQNPFIRVLIMTQGYAEVTHSRVTIRAGKLQISEKKDDNGKDIWENADGGELSIEPDDERLKKECVRIKNPDGKMEISSITRGCGVPEYRGILELRRTAEGIVVINEVAMEDYLCAVVPSEMPSDFEMEALKAQAVCARSYAYRQTADYAYPEYMAHINDSTDFQVYGNSGEQETTTLAVEETKGEVARFNGEIAPTYYYSTSCGKTASISAWGTQETEENSFLRSVEVKGEGGDYEKDLPWYRWSADISTEEMSNLASLNTGNDLGRLHNIIVSEVGTGGNVQKIILEGGNGQTTVETENKIRRVFGGGSYLIKKQDGTEITVGELLPSSFFTIAATESGYHIEGGGFGHGIGMSQNGANEMAGQGKNYREILYMFYPGITIEPMT